MGMYFLRNFLFLSVCLPDPSILMRYWRTSITMPVRSHLFGWWPVWFWILTLLPIFTVLGLWCAHSVCPGEACDGALMPFLSGLGSPSMSDVVVFSR